MKILRIHTRDWVSEAEIIDDLMIALQAPKWLTRDIDALWDSIVDDNLNGIRPPFKVIITNTSRATRDIERSLARLENLFSDLGAAGNAVAFSLHPGR